MPPRSATTNVSVFAYPAPQDPYPSSVMLRCRPNETRSGVPIVHAAKVAAAMQLAFAAAHQRARIRLNARRFHVRSDFVAPALPKA